MKVNLEELEKIKNVVLELNPITSSFDKYILENGWVLYTFSGQKENGINSYALFYHTESECYEIAERIKVRFATFGDYLSRKRKQSPLSVLS